jgi:hypothetical protein
LLPRVARSGKVGAHLLDFSKLLPGFFIGRAQSQRVYQIVPGSIECVQPL